MLRLSGETIWVFTGLRVVDPGTDADVPVGKDFSLVMPNPVILSARSRHAMNEREYWEAERDYRYLMYKRTFSYEDDPAESRALCEETLRRAIMAFQIIKPPANIGLYVSWHGIAKPGVRFGKHLPTTANGYGDVGSGAAVRYIDASAGSRNDCED